MTNIRNYMLSIQVNIAIQLLGTLSESDLQAFDKEYSKRFANSQAKPKNQKNQIKFDYNDMAAQILAKHRAKNIQLQVA